MEGYTEILVGTDGSATAMRAVEAAIRLAQALGVPLTVLSAWEDAEGEQAYLRAREHTEQAVALAEQRGLSGVTNVEPAGDAAEQLLAVVEHRRDCLLVIGSDGLDSPLERIGGNVPHAITHHSPVDVLLIRPDGGAGWNVVAAATDGSTTATRAVRRGVAVARALGVTPRLVTVARNEEEAGWALSAVATSLEGTDFDQEVVDGSSGSPARPLIDAAANWDLLVIGNRGMSGPSRLLGSVSNKVTHEMPTDLLLVNTSNE